jgi:hypothetical protein
MNTNIPALPTLDQIMSLIAEDARPWIRSVLFANAIAEGFANSTSDIDVLLIMDDGYNANETCSLALFGSKRVDFQAIRSSYLITGVKRLMSEPLSRESIMALHRIYSALPIYGTAYWADLIGPLDIMAFRDKVTWFYFDDNNSLIEDLEGNYLENDSESAVANSALLLACGLDAFLASVGKTNPRAKWRIKQLRSLGPDRQWMLECFVDLSQGAPLLQARTSLDAYLSRVTRFAHWLQLAVVVQKLISTSSQDMGSLLPRHTFDAGVARPDFRAVSRLDPTQGIFALLGMGKPKRIDLTDVIACLGAACGIRRDCLEQLVLATQPQGLRAPGAAARLIGRWEPLHDRADPIHRT